MTRRTLLLLVVALNAFGAGRALSPPSTGPSANYVNGAITAYSGNRFLTIWSESMGDLGRPTMGILHDATGRLASSHSFPVLPTDSYLTLVDGGVLRTREIALPPIARRRIEWNGTGFLAVDFSNDSNPATLSVLARSGAVRASIQLTERIYDAHVSPASRGFTLATWGPEGLCARRIMNAGTIEWTRCLPGGEGGYDLHSATTAGGGALLAWTTDGQLRSAVLRQDGAGAIHVLATTNAPRTIDLVRAGEQFLLLFRNSSWEWSLKSLVIDAKGAARSPVRNVTPRDTGANLSAASSGNATLAVFDSMRVTPRPRSVVIANDGTAAPPEDLVIGLARQSQPALAVAGSRILASWTDAFERDARLVTASLQTDGEPMFHQVVAYGDLASRELASNGSELLILSKHKLAQDDTKMQASRVDLDGAPRGAPILLGDARSEWSLRSAAATWTGDRWLVVWSSPTRFGIHAAVIRNDTVESTRPIAINTPVQEEWGRVVAHVSFARNESTTLLVWTEAHDLTCAILPPCGDVRYHTYAARVAADGSFLDPAPLAIPSAATSLSVATSGSEFVILTGGTAHVVDATGRHLLRSTTIFDYDAAGDVAWNGSHYSVALRYKLAGWYLSVTHLDREGNLLGAARGIETLPAHSLVAPSIAGSVIALQEGDFTNGTRAVVYEEQQLEPLPPPPPSPIPHFQVDDLGDYEVTWDPVPGAQLYVVEEYASDDMLFDPVHVIPATAPLRVWVGSRATRVMAVGPGGTSRSPVRRRSARP